MLGIVIIKEKTYKRMQSELERLQYALDIERNKNKTLESGCKKQLAEKDKLIKELTKINKVQQK